jgi:two-component system sensor histidine kinase/response regulator
VDDAVAIIGMNGHVAKPVDPDVPCAMRTRWPPAPTALAMLGAIDGFDVGRGLALFAGRSAVYFRILRRFATTYAQGMVEIDQAVAGRSLTGLAQAGHSLRGASGSIGAVHLERAGHRLESFAMTPEPHEAQKAAALQTQTELIEVSRCILAAVGHDSEHSALADG